jgi:hypothetical protein
MHVSAATNEFGPPPSRSLIGTARLVDLAYGQGNVEAVWAELVKRVSDDPGDSAAYMDLSVVLQICGQREKGLEIQQAAIGMQRCYRCEHGDGTGLRILAIVTAGDLMANTPIDFLLVGSNAVLWTLYVDAATPSWPELPDVDVAFVAVGESEANQPVLNNLRRLLASWKGPILNNAPERIAALAREDVPVTFAGELSIVSPKTVQVDRDALALLSRNGIDLDALLPGERFPIIVRPTGSHAGAGLERISHPADLGLYLGTRTEKGFYVAPYIAYESGDGLYRKQRIAFIDGKAFPSHLAVSEHWMVHYLSAGMSEHPERRSEEEEWMQSFDVDFALRHRAAFDALYRRIGLDYFVIDCAELPDGRLLLFEADIAMIVHAMDSAVTFPYKKAAMDKLFRSFVAALEQRRSGNASNVVALTLP